MYLITFKLAYAKIYCLSYDIIKFLKCYDLPRMKDCAVFNTNIIHKTIQKSRGYLLRIKLFTLCVLVQGYIKTTNSGPIKKTLEGVLTLRKSNESPNQKTPKVERPATPRPRSPADCNLPPCKIIIFQVIPRTNSPISGTMNKILTQTKKYMV